jgi:mannosylglycoprotein endo-beta-mannosidase
MEPHWFSTPNFVDTVMAKWPRRENQNILDFWKIQQNALRKFLRGWAINIKSVQRRQKEELTNELKNLNTLGDAGLLEEEVWQRRYKLEADMMQIYAAEEEYWQRRGGEQWLLKGDSNTAFFHSVANGRRRKTAIVSLVDKDDLIEDNEQLKRHINDYYKNLFGKEPVSPMGLKEDTWANEGRISVDDCIELVKPFSMEEIEIAIKHTKTNTAPGPDGFPVQFYKTFWPKVKEMVKEMLDDMAAGRLNLGRLN